jgi:CubicO group peptidase (beta-lactamase class C family)
VNLSERLEQLVTRQIEAGLMRGLQAYVSVDGKPLVDGAFGRRAQDDDAMTPETRIAIFSSTKSLTATALLLLVEADEIALHDPVVRYLPEFGAEGKSGITLRHLLLHQAGIPDAAETVAPAAFVDFDDAVAQICRLIPESAPGERVDYHVLTGMAVVAAVVQRVSGMGFRELCQEQVLQPLGMTRTTLGLPSALAYEATDTVATEPSREPVCALWSSEVARAGLHPAIGGYSTARDLGRFYEDWLGAVTGRPGLLRPATARLATALHARLTDRFGFGYGFMVGSEPAGPLSRGALCSPRTFGHPGMCSSQAFADPAIGLVVVLLANGDPGQAESDRRFALLSDLIVRAVSE